MKKGKAREGTAIQIVAALIPALSALPSAYFVGRSAFYWLIQNWHETEGIVWTVLGLIVAVIVGIVVEGLGTVAIFLAVTFSRWNNVKAKRQGYDRAPFGLACLSVGVYVATTVVLLVLLETFGQEAARYAPMVFPFLTIVGGLCWAMYDQHRDRLAEKGLSWNWVPEHVPSVPERQEQVRNVDETQRALLTIWEAEPGLSLEQTGKRLGISKTTVHRKRLELEAMKLVERTPNGVSVRNNGWHK